MTWSLLKWELPLDEDGDINYEGGKWNKICDDARKIHEEMEAVLQIAVRNNGVKKGLYHTNDSYEWKKVNRKKLI